MKVVHIETDTTGDVAAVSLGEKLSNVYQTFFSLRVTAAAIAVKYARHDEERCHTFTPRYYIILMVHLSQYMNLTISFHYFAAQDSTS